MGNDGWTGPGPAPEGWPATPAPDDHSSQAAERRSLQMLVASLSDRLTRLEANRDSLAREFDLGTVDGQESIRETDESVAAITKRIEVAEQSIGGLISSANRLDERVESEFEDQIDFATNTDARLAKIEGTVSGIADETDAFMERVGVHFAKSEREVLKFTERLDDAAADVEILDSRTAAADRTLEAIDATLVTACASRANLHERIEALERGGVADMSARTVAPPKRGVVVPVDYDDGFEDEAVDTTARALKSSIADMSAHATAPKSDTAAGEMVIHDDVGPPVDLVEFVKTHGGDALPVSNLPFAKPVQRGTPEGDAMPFAELDKPYTLEPRFTGGHGVLLSEDEFNLIRAGLDYLRSDMIRRQVFDEVPPVRQLTYKINAIMEDPR